MGLLQAINSSISCLLIWWAIADPGVRHTGISDDRRSEMTNATDYK
jgi:hypothetical protein